MKKIGIGVLGVGGMGKRHAENLRRLTPGAELLAVADVAAARARQVADELEIPKSYGSLEALLENKDIRAVLIATPDKFHAQSIIQAAKTGKDILCEKPIALTMTDAYAALDAVAKAGVRLQIGFMRRYDPAYAAAMKRIEAGEIGTPLIFKSVGRDKDEPPMAAYQSGVNGMILYNNTIHDFDLARWLMRDEIAEVHTYGTVAIRPEVAQYGDVVASSVNLKYHKGGIGNIESYVQAVYAYDVRTEILGSKGAVFVEASKKFRPFSLAPTVARNPLPIISSRASPMPISPKCRILLPPCSTISPSASPAKMGLRPWPPPSPPKIRSSKPSR